jgi:hypothetical protein
VQAPQRKADCAAVWTFGETPSQTAHRETVIASFAGRAKAEGAWRQLTNGLPDNARARLFGESLLVAFSTDADRHRAACFERLQLLTTNIAVDSTNFRVSLSLSCIASNAAEAQSIEEELNRYLTQTAYMHLLPPWSPAFESDRVRLQRARSTYSRVQDAGSGIYTNAGLRSLSKRIAQARRSGDSAKVAQLVEEHKALKARLKESILADLRAEGPDKIDLPLMDEYLVFDRQRKTGAEVDYRTEIRKFGARLGQLELNGDEPAPSAARHSVLYGYCRRTGLLLNVSALTFYDPAEGVPALADWLCRRGCVGLQYDFNLHSSFAGEISDAEEER